MNDIPETTPTATPTPFTDGVPVVPAPVAPAAEAIPEAPAETVPVTTEVPTAPEAAPEVATTEAPASETAAESQVPPKAEKKRGADRGNKDRKPPKTNQERKADWRERLLSTKIIKSELFISALCDYALTHGGYNSRRSWGNVLIRMHEHLAYRLRNRLEALSPNDMEYICKRLMGFLADKPLGEGPIAWNTNFPDNFTQRTEVDKYFGCNCKLRDIAPQDRILLAFRDAAWPSRLEEEKGIGGSFAERYHYLVVSVVKFMTTGQEYVDGMFEGCYHMLPTDEYLEWQRKVQEKYDAKFGNRRAGSGRPKWIGADGKCTECGSEIIKDAQGHDICSNALCDHNIAPVSDSMSGFGRKAPRSEPRDFQPLPSGGGKRDGKDRRHNRNDFDNEMQFGRKTKKHGKRFHAREDGDEPTGGVYGNGVGEARTIATSGSGEGFGALAAALDGVKVD